MLKTRTLSRINVFPEVSNPRRGRIIAGNMVIPCALGAGATTHKKREGDGATPLGTHHPVLGFYRADKVRRPNTAVPMRAMRQSDGWCDDVSHRSYNRHVTRPFTARHEKMWRDDHLYDIVLDLGWNMRPRIHGRGSAIFLHIAKDNFGPTEGCIAIPRHLAQRFLSVIGPHTKIIVGSDAKPVRKQSG